MKWIAVLKRVSLCAGPLLLLVACGGGGGSSGPASSSGSSGGSSANYAQIADELNGFVASSPDAEQVKGYAFMLIDQQGTVLYQTAGGNLSASDAIPIASASKLPSALAILSLTDSGKLSLDTPVSAYLAGSAVTWPQSLSAITLRMLLSHTSGLPGLQDYNNPSCISDQTSGITLAQCVQDIADGGLGMATAASQPYQPGQQFDYGGADFQVAGYIATLVSGYSSWQDFFSAAIGTPLGLSSSFTYDNGSANPRIAGGVSAGVADYVKILQTVLNEGSYNGKQLVSAATIENSLEVNQISGLTVAFDPLPTSDYPGYSFGLFFSAQSVYSPSPGPEFSDPGEFGTTPWLDTGLKYGAILLIDQNSSTGIAIWNAVRPTIIQNLQGG